MKSLLLLASFLTLTSCLKAPSQTEDHGPIVPPSEVQKAVAVAWGDVDPATIRKNEFMYLEQDQKISTLDPRVVYKESTQVSNREVNADSIVYDMILRTTTLDEDGNFKQPTSTQQTITIDRDQSESVSSAAFARPALPNSIETLQKSMAKGTVGLTSQESDPKIHERALGLQTVMNMYGACVRADGWDVTCHNLQVTSGMMPPPTGIASKPNCGNVPNCQVHFTKIAFDLVVTVPNDSGDGTHSEKVIYDMTISPDVPYLSRLTEFCY
ncbi:MAG: hypothetical protein EOP06_20210, partial [Proteobacteria bacterium]